VLADPSPRTVGGEVTISATVTDDDTDLNDLTVTVHITDPEGTLVGQFVMTYDSGTDKFEYTSNFDKEGTYTFIIYAEDEDDNTDSATGSFEMVPELREYNWKPILALAFTIILILLGLLVSHRRPLRLKGILQKDRLLTFLGGVLPFAIAESITGIISLATGELSIPPLMGAGLAVDLAILIAGILTILAILRKGKPVTTYGAEPSATPSGAYQIPLEGETTGMEDQEVPVSPQPEEGSVPPEPDVDTGVPPPPPPPSTP